MDDTTRTVLRRGIAKLVRQARYGTPLEVREEEDGWGQLSGSGEWDRERTTKVVVRTEGPTPAEELPPLDTARVLALNVLLDDPGMIADALADYVMDRGHDYAAAVAEKARAEERARVAERLLGEAARALHDPGELGEAQAAALRAAAESLILAVPSPGPTSAESTA